MSYQEDADACAAWLLAEHEQAKFDAARGAS